jgi:hypothetical protein
MTGYLTDRFTAEMHIRVPQGMRVFASGAREPKPVTWPTASPATSTTSTGQAGISRHGDRRPLCGPGLGRPGNVKVYLTVSHQAVANQLAQTAAKEYDFFTDSFGAPESSHLNVVELPDDTLPAVWAPELAAILGSRVGDKSGVRLLANTIAHQWWGSEVSPRTLNDAWITNGMARYGELMYLEDESGKSAMRDGAAGCGRRRAGLRHHSAVERRPLSPFSPEFQSMTLEKGAMVFHMLRWEIGDKAFLATLKGALSQYTDKPMRTADFEKVAEAQSQQQLTAFFAQWIDGTGAPQFTDKYAVYRLGNNKGFRTIGEISRTSTSSACRWSCASRPTARPKPEDRRGGHRHAIRGGHLRPPAAHQPSTRRTGCSSPRPTCRCASPFSRASNWWRRAT